MERERERVGDGVSGCCGNRLEKPTHPDCLGPRGVPAKAAAGKTDKPMDLQLDEAKVIGCKEIALCCQSQQSF